MICNIVERAGIEPATLTRVRPAFPLSYLPIYPLIAGIACPAHTTPRKGITHLSLSCILQAHTWRVLCRCRPIAPALGALSLRCSGCIPPPAAPAALQIHTVFRFPDLGRDTACRQFKPDFYIPLLARGIDRSAARYDLPRYPHAGLGTQAIGLY